MRPAALFDESNERGAERTVDPRLPEMHRLLLERYGRPAAREMWDPLTQFIYSLLSSRTKTAEAMEVMRELRRAYTPGGRNCAMRRWGISSSVIGAVTFAEVKAPRLKMALLQITARYGTLTLDFLAKYRTKKIREWLEQFEGVGPQVSAAVVNFSTLRRRALCVDANHLRVVQRLALTPRADGGVTEERLMRVIPDEWDAAMLDEHHSLVKLHAQTLCTFAEPKCEGCPLLGMCPHGKRRVGAEA